MQLLRTGLSGASWFQQLVPPGGEPEGSGTPGSEKVGVTCYGCPSFLEMGVQGAIDSPVQPKGLVGEVL
jgi:hypothetical protein